MSDFDLKWDAENQELYGEDPDTGNKVPVPIGSLSTNTLEASGTIGNAVYQSPSDIPAEYEEEGKMVYTISDGLVIFSE